MINLTKMSNLIKVHNPRPTVHFKSHLDEVDDADNGIIYPLSESGYRTRTDISDTIDRWQLRPVDALADPTLTKSHKRRNKAERSAEWLAYEAVIVSNRYHPEDVITLYKYLSESFERVIQQKLEAIAELKAIHEREEIDNGQCEQLVGFLNDILKRAHEDRARCLAQLLDLILLLKEQPHLWAGETPCK